MLDRDEQQTSLELPTDIEMAGAFLTEAFSQFVNEVAKALIAKKKHAQDDKSTANSAVQG